MVKIELQKDGIYFCITDDPAETKRIDLSEKRLVLGYARNETHWTSSLFSLEMYNAERDLIFEILKKDLKRLGG